MNHTINVEIGAQIKLTDHMTHHVIIYGINITALQYHNHSEQQSAI